MTYSEKLKDPSWQKRRLQVFERDGWACCKCGCKTNTLEVHHLFYFAEISPWDYPDDLLETLCSVCHDKERGREELQKNLANSLKIKGFFYEDLLALSTLIDTNERFVESLRKALNHFQK